MPRRPKLRYSHSQGQGSERYFKNRSGTPVEMIDLFGSKRFKGVAGKTKMGTWSLPRLLKITRGKK